MCILFFSYLDNLYLGNLNEKRSPILNFMSFKNKRVNRIKSKLNFLDKDLFQGMLHTRGNTSVKEVRKAFVMILRTTNLLLEGAWISKTG